MIADTHSPEFLDHLPDRLFEVLRGVDLILHAGDITGAETLAQLERIAPVAAVRGDHDGELGELPASREVMIEGRRIVVVHGNRTHWIEEPQTFLWTVSLGYLRPNAGLPANLRRRFSGADAIVFGHTHRPHVETRDGILLFNPGGVHQWTPATAKKRLAQNPDWFEWSWLQVARHIRKFSKPSIGILEVSASSIVPTVVDL